MRITTILKVSTVLVLLMALAVPLVGAVSGDSVSPNSPTYLARDDPQIIAALKTHVVYLAESQEARMDGVIRYTDCISNGSGAEDLRWIQEDYLTAASSIPLMYTSDQIDAARKEMMDQSVRFSDETADQLVMFNGNVDSMRSSINDSMEGFDATFNDPNKTPWLTTARARLTVFNESANDRNATLASLRAQGIDVTSAEKISDEINGEYVHLMGVLTHRGDSTVEQFNSRTKLLNQNFRGLIREYRATLQIQARLATTMAIKE